MEAFSLYSLMKQLRMLLEFCQHQGCTTIADSNHDILNQHLIAQFILNEHLIQFVYRWFCSGYWSKACKTWANLMPEILHSSPVFLRQTVTHISELHKDNLFMAILPHRRSCQAIDILSLHLPQHVLKSVGSSMMAFIHDDHAIICYTLIHSIILSVITCIGGMLICGAYHKLWRYFDRKDYLCCVNGTLIGITVSCIFTYVLKGEVPLLYACLHAALSIVGICLFRLIFKRTFIDLTTAGRHEARYRRTMIIGGGQACRMLLSEIRNAQSSPHTGDKSTAVFDPVCILDDDRSKVGTTLFDTQIVGTTAEIEKYIREFEVEQIMF